MREFIKGFKGMYRDVFNFFHLDKEDLGGLCAVISMIMLYIVFTIGIVKMCYYLGRMEVRKEYQAEVKYEQPKTYENSGI